MMKNCIYVTLLIIPIWLACGRKELTEKTYHKFLKNPKNGLVQEKTINQVKFRLAYRPTDMLVKQELQDDIFNEKTIDSLRKKYVQQLYFVLSLSINDKDLLRTAPRDMNEFGKWVHKLAFRMEKNVYLTTSQKDTLTMLTNHFSRMYGMTPETSVLFVFEKKYLDSEWLRFEIKDLGLNTGNVKFKIDPKKIKNAPTLKFN